MPLDTQKLKSEEASKTVAEILRPDNLPEAAFSSYSYFINNSGAVKSSFMSGEDVNPRFEYSMLSRQSLEDELNRDINNLFVAGLIVEAQEDGSGKSTDVLPSLIFRAAEMEYVKLLAEINRLAAEGVNEQELLLLVDQAKDVGESLYGRVDPSILNGALVEIWKNIESKELDVSAIPIYQELKNGFYWNNGKFIPALEEPKNNDYLLPSFDDESLDWLGNILLERFADIKALVDDFWAEKVEKHGEDYKASPEDIAEVFTRAIRYYDPNSESNINVVIDPDAKSLSWEASRMSIVVGGQRVPIDSKLDLFKKILHELCVHTGRAIEGLKSDLPVLGTGLYSNTTEPDYLTFEEGFATIAEEAIDGDSDSSWKPLFLGHYMSIAMIDNGEDFRTVFEKTWRWRLLMSLDPGQDVTEEMIENEKSTSYTALVRVFRGTPVNIQEVYPNIRPISFNQDLAYLNGRVKALKYLKELYEAQDEEGLMYLFKGKFDPTNKTQMDIAQRYLT